MTDTRTADDLWRWLAACRNCGKPHEYRPVNGDPQSRGLWTWASPLDGHTYVTRLDRHRLVDLRAEWVATR